MVDTEAQFYNAMKNTSCLTEVLTASCCVAKLIQEMYHFRGLFGGFCWDFLSYANLYFVKSKMYLSRIIPDEYLQAFCEALYLKFMDKVLNRAHTQY